jgi:competence protein ComEA
LKEFLIAFFNLTRKERRGTIALIFILIVLIIFKQFNGFWNEPISLDKTTYFNILDSLRNTKTELKVEAINPNTASFKELLSIGLSAKQARMVQNYLKKGYTFTYKDDVKKIYSIQDSDYHKISAFINLPIKPVQPYSKKGKIEESHYSNSSNAKNGTPNRTKLIININSADSLEWISLNGIGPTLASRIIKYRKRLGGFYAIQQLKEVYGVSDSLLQVLEPKLSTDNNYQRIFINRIQSSDKWYHPYLSYKKLHTILNYRMQHGNFASTDELLDTKVLTTEELNRLKPYLSIE